MFTAGLIALFVSGAAATTRSASLQAALAQNEATAYTFLPDWTNADATSPLNLIKFAAEDMSATFDDYQDTLPDGRSKLIHARGAVGAIKFNIVANPNKHTGLFATGGDSCLARLSVAVDPNSKFSPGVAIKCYRDNQPSGNIISMFNLDGQGDNWDYFANTFTNIIGNPTSAALKFLQTTILNRASSCSTHLSLKQWSSIDEYGNVAATPSWPEQIYFKPAGIHFSTVAGHGDFRDDLATIPIGSKLWDVYVSEAAGGTSYKIAEVVTAGKIVASSYSDNTLFFQHDRGEDDNCQ
jgi:hypothetical protein